MSSLSTADEIVLQYSNVKFTAHVHQTCLQSFIPSRDIVLCVFRKALVHLKQTDVLSLLRLPTMNHFHITKTINK